MNFSPRPSGMPRRRLPVRWVEQVWQVPIRGGRRSLHRSAFWEGRSETTPCSVQVWTSTRTGEGSRRDAWRNWSCLYRPGRGLNPESL